MFPAFMASLLSQVEIYHPAALIIGIIGVLVVLILILFLFIRTSGNSPTAVVGLDNKQEISVVEQELDIDLSPSGLLSRIQQNKKD